VPEVAQNYKKYNIEIRRLKAKVAELIKQAEPIDVGEAPHLSHHNKGSYSDAGGTMHYAVRLQYEFTTKESADKFQATMASDHSNKEIFKLRKDQDMDAPKKKEQPKKYKAIRRTDLQTLIHHGACSKALRGLVDDAGFDCQCSLQNGQHYDLCNSGLIKYAEANNYIDWLIEKGFIEEVDQLSPYRVGDVFRQSELGIVVLTARHNEYSLARLEDLGGCYTVARIPNGYKDRQISSRMWKDMAREPESLTHLGHITDLIGGK
jgi:hypothetical protein